MNEIHTELIEELAAFLDRQSESLSSLDGCLEELRKALIRRDLAALEDLQARLAGEARIRTQLEESRQRIQQTLAGLLGCDPQAVCLSALERHLHPSSAERIRQRRLTLAEQVRRLRERHLATELLVRECARMNQRLLEAILGTDRKGRTYDARGHYRRSSGPGLMNMKL